MTRPSSYHRYHCGCQDDPAINDHPISLRDDLDRLAAHRHSGHDQRLATASESAITAQVVDINDERVADGGLVSVDTVEIRRDGLVVAQVEVSSAQERAPYDRAVRRVIGAAEFTWLPEGAS